MDIHDPSSPLSLGLIMVIIANSVTIAFSLTRSYKKRIRCSIFTCTYLDGIIYIVLGLVFYLLYNK